VIKFSPKNQLANLDHMRGKDGANGVHAGTRKLPNSVSVRFCRKILPQLYENKTPPRGFWFTRRHE
jgi:hypothetical protein